MAAITTELLTKFKASLASQAAAWSLENAMQNTRQEALFSTSDPVPPATSGTLGASTSIVHNDSFVLKSAPLKLTVVVMAEYTDSEIRSIALIMSGATFATTDAPLLATLQAMATAHAIDANAAALASLDLPTP